jgi:regulator of sirC expression with transglutaminase-like and TPR domain
MRPQTVLRRFLDDANSDELAAALLVTQLIDANADVIGARRELEALTSAFLRNGKEPSASPHAVCDFLAAEGFEGASDYYALENSRLDHVLTARRGIPITLAIVYLAIARAAGLDAHGLNAPGHFLVATEDAMIDPFTLRVLSPKERNARVAQNGGAPLERATPLGIALRMLNNVRTILAARQDWVGVLTMLDHQVVLSPTSAELHLARAEVWERLGARDAARAALEDARRLAGDELAKHIDAVLARLGSGGSVLH